LNSIKVVVNGAFGKMGAEVLRAVSAESDMRVVGAVEFQPETDELILPGGGAVPLGADIAVIIDKTSPDVVVDFTNREASLPAVRIAMEKGVNLVIGSTGFSEAEVADMQRLAAEKGIGVVLAANFALGAVLMMHLAGIAGKYFDNVEITELHHDRKADAPSGTALSTARGMLAARGKPFHRQSQLDDGFASRGESRDGLNIHSVRLPGLVAHQEVLFGGVGQTLSIRHDSINRESFMPGVILAVREVMKHKTFIRGLEPVLGLQEK
jgi:4-hydroxy-tetrahydrodipicolinate reductase